MFAPVYDLGLIIIDEEHEQSYRSEHKPQYTAHEVAEKRCSLTGATLAVSYTHLDVYKRQVWRQPIVW